MRCGYSEELSGTNLEHLTQLAKLVKLTSSHVHFEIVQVHGVDWARLPLGTLCAITTGLPAIAVCSIAEALVLNYPEWAGGLADLLYRPFRL